LVSLQAAGRTRLRISSGLFCLALANAIVSMIEKLKLT